MTRWRARAFGLDLAAEFPLAGLAHEDGRDGHRPTSIELASGEELERGFGRERATRILDWRRPSGRRLATIDAHERDGFIFYGQGCGRFRVSKDGRRVRCAPLKVAAWRWQRYLAGQVLPFAAVLQGLEVFHASAVVIGGRAIGIVGDSGTGKTSLAARLVLGGARFLTDDVLAVEPDSGRYLAHPGVGLTNLRLEAASRLSRAELERLGRPLGRDEEALRIQVDRHSDPAPLAALYFIDRRPRSSKRTIEELSPVDPRLLLGSSFNLVLRAPERLTNQLNVCAGISRSVSVFRAIVSPSADAAMLATRIHGHVAGLGSRASAEPARVGPER